MRSSRRIFSRAAAEALLILALCVPAAATHDAGLGKSQDGPKTTTTDTALTTSSLPATPEPSALLLFIGLGGTSLLMAGRKTGDAS